MKLFMSFLSRRFQYKCSNVLLHVQCTSRYMYMLVEFPMVKCLKSNKAINSTTSQYKCFKLFPKNIGIVQQHLQIWHLFIFNRTDRETACLWRDECDLELDFLVEFLGHRVRFAHHRPDAHQVLLKQQVLCK